MSFQRTVMIVAIVLLICALLMIGTALHNQKNNDDIVFPPVVGDCPDYWVNESSDDDKLKCVNEKKLGSCHADMEFSLPMWKGNSGLCNKFKWARDCGITWDGVTNNPKACL